MVAINENGSVEDRMAMLCHREFNTQFGDGWIRGFIQMVIMAPKSMASLCFVRFRSGEGRWFKAVNFGELAKVATILIEKKQLETPRYNTIRVHVRQGGVSDFDYMEDTSVLKKINETDFPELSPGLGWENEENMIRLSVGFLQSQLINSFLCATFRYYRFQDRFCGILRVDDPNDEVIYLEIPLAEEEETILQEVWRSGRLMNWEVLQVLIDRNFSCDIVSFEDQVLRTLESKVFPST